MALSLIWTIVIMVAVSFAVTAMMRTKQKTPIGPDPEDKIDAPLAEEGTPVPVLFGTRRLKGPNVVWWGDLSSTAIRR